jgi:hypothetical protein
MIRPCAALLALIPLTAAAALPDYTDTELQARSNLLVNDEGYNLPPGSSFNSISADIDDASMVAFRVQLVPDEENPNLYRPGVWFGGHGSGALVYTGPIDASIDNDVCLTHSEGSEVVSIPFTLSTGGVGNTLYLYGGTVEGGGSAEPFNTAPVIPNSYSYPCLSTAGSMSFQADYGSGRAYVTVVDDGGIEVTAFIGDENVTPGNPYTYLYTPSFNDHATIAAKVAYSKDMTSSLEIRLFANGGDSRRLLANNTLDTSSPYSKFDNGLALNNNDTIAVVATRAADNRRVLVRSDGVTTEELAEVDPSGTIRDIEFFAPAINDDGLVAFRARDADGQAIYVADGTGLKRVIGNADVVDTDLGTGQIGQDNSSDPIFSGKPAINAHGDIAFIAGLYPQGNNGEEWGSGVFVAYAESVVDDIVFADGFDG